MNLREVLNEMGKSHTKLKGKRKGYSDLFTVDLKNRTIKNRDTVLVERGEIKPQTICLVDGRELELENNWGLTDEEFYTGLENRFEKYHLSCPIESDRHVKNNFVFKDTKEFSYEEFMKGSVRGQERYELDWWVMANAVNKRIKWENEKHWYWQSKRFPKLILYKMYV